MNLLGKALDKNFWKDVRVNDCFEKHRCELFNNWEKYCKNDYFPALRYRDFKLFWQTGNRGVYEEQYFNRRMALDTSALLSLIYPEEEKYLIFLMDVIYAICDEYTWCLPAHHGELEPNNNVQIDLFAAETGFALSEIYAILGDRLDPLVKNRIEAEVDRRIFTPYVYEKRNYWWEKSLGNWTAVCVGSVACTVMLLRPDLFDSLKDRFYDSMEIYLSSFPDDGVCLEGCGYWHYGFGFFTVFADMVKHFTKGKTDYFIRDNVRSIAAFLQKMFISDGIGVSFSDGTMDLTYHLGTLHYLKSVYPDDIAVISPIFSYNYDNCGRFCLYLRSFTWLYEEYYRNPAPSNTESEFYAGDAQWFIKRTPYYGFAAKGGHNAEAHNNNDVGTFIFAKNGRQLLQDIGRGVYSKQYFSDATRYGILECSSRGHSVPIINGKYQLTGRNAAAKNTEYENGIFSMDISGAYDSDSPKEIKRSFAFTENTVILKDEFISKDKTDIVERIVTLFKPEIKSCNTVSVEDAVITFDPSAASVSINEEIREKGDICYFIDFKLKSNENIFKIEIK